MLACEPQGRTIPNYLVMDLEAYICSNNAEMIERERRDGRLRQSDFFVSWEGYFNGLTPIEYAESLTNADRALHAMRATRI